MMAEFFFGQEGPSGNPRRNVMRPFREIGRGDVRQVSTIDPGANLAKAINPDTDTPSPIGAFVLSGRKTSRQKAEEGDARTLAGVQSLRSEILGNKAITDVTRQEFLRRLNPNAGDQGRISQFRLEKTRAQFQAANLGEGKFGQRQDLQARINDIVDRPGRRQTILTR